MLDVNMQTNNIYQPPMLQDVDFRALELVAGQRERVRRFAGEPPQRWDGWLRRAMLAKAIQGSNSIEGIHADLDTAVAAIQQEPPLDEQTETWFAIAGYRAAMTYIIQAARDPFFEFSKQFLKSLHFMITGYTMSSQPGQWRSGTVYVVNSRSGETVYDAPQAEIVDALVTRLVDGLKIDTATPPLIQAAMAHLNLTMIHPFKDGNGRVARALQTLVNARDGIIDPVLCSIEEWLGDHTQEYYDVLAEVGQGKWNPERDALPWVRFCVKAHYQQAAKQIRRNEEASKLFDSVMEVIKNEKLPERAWMPIFDAALGLRVTNLRYRTDAEITDYTAGRDLKRLSEAGLLAPKGEKRNRFYVAAKPVTDLRNATRIRRFFADPYALLAGMPSPPNQEVDVRLPGL